MNTDRPSLFVWRGAESFEEALPSHYGEISFSSSSSPCPFCGALFERTVIGRGFYWKGDELRLQCKECGFHVESFEDLRGIGTGVLGMGDAYPASICSVARLRELEINSSELGLGELGAHLRRHVSDIYAITPRRFEVLCADIFRNLGYHVQLTKQTRDGGYDLLLSDTGGSQVLVECKRYSRHRRVRVSAVRELLGVQLAKGVRYGKLVTSAFFTEPAQSVAVEVNDGDTGFHLDLIDLEVLTTHLAVYNLALPPRELQRRMLSTSVERGDGTLELGKRLAD